MRRRPQPRLRPAGLDGNDVNDSLRSTEESGRAEDSAPPFSLPAAAFRSTVAGGASDRLVVGEVATSPSVAAPEARLEPPFFNAWMAALAKRLPRERAFSRGDAGDPSAAVAATTPEEFMLTRGENNKHKQGTTTHQNKGRRAARRADDGPKGERKTEETTKSHETTGRGGTKGGRPRES